jgi:hypothetical protein
LILPLLCFDFATRYLNLTAIHLQTSAISYYHAAINANNWRLKSA